MNNKTISYLIIGSLVIASLFIVNTCSKDKTKTHKHTKTVLIQRTLNKPEEIRKAIPVNVNNTIIDKKGLETGGNWHSR